MARNIKLQSGSKVYQVNVPSQLVIKSFPELFGKISKWLTVAFIALFLGARLFLPTYGDSAGLVLFYALSIVLLVDLIIHYVSQREKEVVEAKLFMPTILFVIFNLALTLLPAHAGGLVTNINTYNSGLTLIAVIILFYFITFSAKLRNVNWTDLILKSFLVGVAFSYVINILTNNILFAFQPLLIAVWPLFVMKLVQSQTKARAILLAIICVLGLLNLVVYYRAAINFVDLFIVSITLLIAALTIIVRNPRQKVMDFVNHYQQMPATNAGWAGLVKEYPHFLILFTSIALIVLSIVGANKLNINLLQEVQKLVANYPLQISLFSGDVVKMLTGVTPLLTVQTTMPLLTQIVATGGLLGAASVVLVILVGAFSTIRNYVEQSSNSLKYYFMLITLICLPLWSAFLFLPAAILVAWWLGWILLNLDSSNSD